MGLLEDLLSSGQAKSLFTDFVKRYEQGHPSDGYSDQEVVDRYSQVAHAVPPDQYTQAAQEALSRLSPEERAAFVKMLQERAAAKGVSLPSRVGAEPGDLGQVLTGLHQTPGRLRDILGGGGGDSGVPATQAGGPSALTGLLASPLARAALAGITAMVVKKVVRGA
jgi:hypothetical protein